MDFEKMKRDEAALEAQYNGTTEEVAVAPPPMGDQSTFTTDVVSESVHVSDETITPPTLVKNEENLYTEKRFKNYKASTDTTIFELRKELAGMRVTSGEKDTKIRSLANELSMIREESNQDDPFEGVFNKEDEDTIGEDAIKIIKKATLANAQKDSPKLKALRAEMAEMRSTQRAADKKELDNLEAGSQAKLKATLAGVVPNFSKIDKEAAFSAYLKGIDQLSGSPRMKFFASAIKDNDVARVANFYNEYISQKPKSRSEILSGKVGVTGSGASESTSTGRDSQKKVYSIVEYTDFMTARNSGKLKMTRQEANVIEKRFDIAFQEGRVR
jgi:hypothetical protein